MIDWLFLIVPTLLILLGVLEISPIFKIGKTPVSEGSDLGLAAKALGRLAGLYLSICLIIGFVLFISINLGGK